MRCAHHLRIGRPHVGERQVQSEGTTAAGNTAQADFAAQQVCQLATDGEAQSRATVFARGAGIRLLERLEDDSLLFLRNTDTRVADRKLDDRGSLRQSRVILSPATHCDTYVQSHAAAVREF